MSAHRQTEKQQQKTQQQSPGATGAVTDTDTAQTERHIDNMFPDEASLEGIEVVAENMRRRLTEVRGTLRTLLRAQSASAGQQQQQSVEATKAAINELHQRISEMKAKARTSERMVLDITQDIKALDFAKRNVTQTTTTMRRLQMLIAAVGQLRQLKEQRRWGEAAIVVAAVTGLTEGFADFGRVRPIATLLADAQALQRETAALASAEVERGFDAQGLLVGEARKMRAACECAQALGAQPRVTEHYCKLQMRAYAAIFQLKDDVSQLENVSRRYAWLRRILRNYAESHAEVFPDAWRVAEHLSRRFAEATRDQLGELMATQDTVSAEDLTAALADTLAFEAQCNKKFGIVVAKEQGGGGTGPSHVYESSGEPAASFMGAVSCAFEPYMSIFIRGEQTKFETLVARFQAAPIAVDDDPSLSVLASSTDLLYQFRESLRQCASLSTGQAMLDLAHVFSYSMSSYARDVLIHKLPQSSGSSQQLEDLKHVCLIVNTADYCASVVAQLETKIVERIDEVYKPRVSFAACRDALLGAINKSIRVLVAGVEGLCEPAFAALSQVPWQTLQTVGDQSAYVSLVSSAVKTATESIRGTMSGARYLRSYCDKFAVRFAERYMEAINTCGGISEVGAEQLLLDAQALKSMLLEMPRMGSEDKKQPVPATYQKIVSQGVGRIEALLKAILAPSDPPEALVDRFLLLFPKAPREVFQQVLRLKSVRPGDQ
ncbi:Vps53-like protein, partial [Kickxella alabastrina]|uniref:Vps53-like protein n=1 Tax=Kickxella alabastrina TaxID=61397 RepID=UPI00221E8FEF